MPTDMEDNHCGHCGKYVSPEDGFHGVADRPDSEPQRIYCDQDCCNQAEVIANEALCEECQDTICSECSNITLL